MNRYWIFLFLLFANAATAMNADTLRITIAQADSLFSKKNYRLLAAALNVEAERAQVIQARLYPNPIITAEVNAIDPQNNKLFNAGNAGEKAFQFEQLILIGGKRKAEIEMARTNTAIAELELQGLARQLRFELHKSLYSLDQQIFLLKKYDAQLALLDTIIQAYEVQANKGNIPLKEVVRLKSVYLNINSQRSELYEQHYQELARVQVIIHTNAYVVPIIRDADFSHLQKDVSIDDLNREALMNRADYLIGEQNRALADQYYKLQKRQAIPDVNLFTSYDQRGGAFLNQVNAGISIPLPLWHRNQGNIKSARIRMDMNEYSQELLKQEIQADVQSNFMIYNRARQEFNKVAQFYNNGFEQVQNGVTLNFQKRNITLLEFVDFFEAYNLTLAELMRTRIQLATSAEQLNFVTGKDIF